MKVRMSYGTLLSILVFAVLICVPAMADTAYYGDLSSADGGIDGEAHWITPGPTTISWAVEWVESANAWLYNYTLTVPQYAISHWIIEVSDDFTLSDIWNIEGQHTEILLGTYTGGPGNPGMPGFIYGIKLDGYEWNGGDGLTADLSFYSRRNPVWADFYAKCGGRTVQNAAWNMGLTEFEDDDPLAPPSSGSVNNHVTTHLEVSGAL